MPEIRMYFWAVEKSLQPIKPWSGTPRLEW